MFNARTEEGNSAAGEIQARMADECPIVLTVLLNVYESSEDNEMRRCCKFLARAILDIYIRKWLGDSGYNYTCEKLDKMREEITSTVFRFRKTGKVNHEEARDLINRIRTLDSDLTAARLAMMSPENIKRYVYLIIEEPFVLSYSKKPEPSNEATVSC
jgi:hypothetical protein